VEKYVVLVSRFIVSGPWRLFQPAYRVFPDLQTCVYSLRFEGFSRDTLTLSTFTKHLIRLKRS
jgi:hypothetical protein